MIPSSILFVIAVVVLSEEQHYILLLHSFLPLLRFLQNMRGDGIYVLFWAELFPQHLMKLKLFRGQKILLLQDSSLEHDFKYWNTHIVILYLGLGLNTEAWVTSQGTLPWRTLTILQLPLTANSSQTKCGIVWSFPCPYWHITWYGIMQVSCRQLCWERMESASLSCPGDTIL